MALEEMGGDVAGWMQAPPAATGDIQPGAPETPAFPVGPSSAPSEAAPPNTAPPILPPENSALVDHTNNSKRIGAPRTPGREKRAKQALYAGGALSRSSRVLNFVYTAVAALTGTVAAFDPTEPLLTVTPVETPLAA